MYSIQQSFAFGISPGLLFPQITKGPLYHLEAVARCAALPGFETLEMFLPDDPALRAAEISMVLDAGKKINYNFPVDFQFDGEINAGSDNPQYRQNALDMAYRQIDYAIQGESHLLAITSCVDQGEEKRPVVLDRFGEFCEKIAAYAKPAGIVIAIEAAERGVFKNLLLGPTSETAAFVKSMRARGSDNIAIMIDTAHLPLMDEQAAPALALSLETELAHVHIGNSVLVPESPYYGHQHPPLGIQGGIYDTPDAEELLLGLLKAGYISVSCTGEKPMISVEMLPYTGVSPETSARVVYEKMSTAFEQAACRFVTENRP